MQIEIARNDPEDYSSKHSEEPRREQHGKASNVTDSELEEAADFVNPITPAASRLNNLNKWLTPAAIRSMRWVAAIRGTFEGQHLQNVCMDVCTDRFCRIQ